MNKNRTRYVAFGGIIAALYAVLTWVINLLFPGIANMAIQVRLSEAMTILPVFTPAAVPGLAVGCVLANLLMGNPVWDIVFGSFATLIGAVGTRMLRDKPRIAWIPPVVSNAVIIPFVLIYAYHVPDVEVFGKVFGGNALWPMLALTVGIGEIISCGLLGIMLYQSLKKAKVEF